MIKERDHDLDDWFSGESYDARAEVYTNVMSHPQSAPTMDELQYVTGMSDETLEQTLDALENEYGILEQGELPEQPVVDGEERNSTFYTLTEKGQEFSEQYTSREFLHEIYSRVKKPDMITELEQLPRE